MRSLKSIMFAAVLFAASQGKSFAQFSGGTGTQDDPWQITTLAQLNDMRNHQGYNPSGTVTFVYYKLMNDLVFTASDDLNGDKDGNIDPIPFNYTSFDGNGKTITGAVITQTGNYTGLFSQIYNGSYVRNLGMVNCTITGTSYVGGIAGSSSGEITACFVSGTITATGSGSYVGGITGSGSAKACYNAATVNAPNSTAIGGITGGINGGCVSDCYNTGVVTGKGSVGAIVGNFTGYGGNAIYNSYYLAGTCALGCGYSGTSKYDISAVSKTDAEMKSAAFLTSLNEPFLISYWKAGGADNNGYPVLAWQNGGTIDRRGETADNPLLIANLQDLNKMHNYIQFSRYFKLTADVDLSAAGNFEPIGNGSLNNGLPFVGELDGDNHKITGLNTSRYYNAGLFGSMIGTIKNLTLESATVSGGWYVGGFSGDLSGSIINCSFSGTVTATGQYVGGLIGKMDKCTLFQNCTNSGAVTGNSSVGGLVGYASNSSIGPAGEPVGVMDNCVNTGSINGINGGSGIAGIAAGLQSIAVSNSHNSGTVYAPSCNTVAGLITGINVGNMVRCFNEGAVTGNDYVSGIGSASSGCYNMGNVTGNNYVGGIVGTSQNTESDLYGTSVGWTSGSASGNYLKPSLVGCYNTGTITGNQFVAGITPGKYISGGCFYIQEKVHSQDTRIIETEEGAQGVTEAQLKSQLVVNAMNVALYNQAFSTFDKYYWSATTTGYPTFNAQPGSSPVPVYNVSVSVSPFAAPIEIDGIRFNTKATGSLAQIQLAAGDYSVKIADYADATKQNLHVAGNGAGLTLNSGITSIPDGSGGRIFQLSTPEHLHLMHYANGTSFELLNDIVFTSDKDFSLTAGNFYPVLSFTGSLDGKGHSIKNLSIQADSLDKVGLFATIGGVNSQRIRNLTLENVNIKGRNYVGGIGGATSGAGYKIGATFIDSCRITGVVSGVSNVGGFSGGGGGVISNSSNESSVQGTEYIGGLAGNSSGKISNAINKGTIKGLSNVGGIAGSTTSNINSTYNYGDVSGITSVGGITGFLSGYSDGYGGNYSGTVTNCMNKGTITATGDGGIIGGIAGTNGYSSGLGSGYDQLVLGSCNLGIITVNGGRAMAGGIVGENYRKIKACYNAGEINVSGSGYVGGVEGYFGGLTMMSSYSKLESDSSNYNAGRIVAANAYSGGLFGFIDNFRADSLFVPMFSKLYYLQDAAENINTDIPAVGLWGVKPRVNNPTPYEMLIALTVDQLRSSGVIDSLNRVSTPLWKADLTPNINNGFPILIWQTEGITTSIPQTKTEASANLYVNVKDGMIYINADGFRSASIYNISGQKLLESKLPNINASQLPKGIYIVRVQTNKGDNSQKILIKQE